MREQVREVTRTADKEGYGHSAESDCWVSRKAHPQTRLQDRRGTFFLDEIILELNHAYEFLTNHTVLPLRRFGNV